MSTHGTSEPTAGTQASATPAGLLRNCAVILDDLARSPDGVSGDDIADILRLLAEVAAMLDHIPNRSSWRWEEAFDKFGFVMPEACFQHDGDGVIMTDVVAAVLCAGGYLVTTQEWGAHNTVIVSIRTAKGREQIPRGAYDEPRDYLPPAIVKRLDRAFAHRCA